jgi:hypothetical protein
MTERATLRIIRAVERSACTRELATRESGQDFGVNEWKLRLALFLLVSAVN